MITRVACMNTVQNSSFVKNCDLFSNNATNIKIASLLIQRNDLGAYGWHVDDKASYDVILISASLIEMLHEMTSKTQIYFLNLTISTTTHVF